MRPFKSFVNKRDDEGLLPFTVAYLFLGRNSGLILQSIADDVDTHCLASLVVKVLKQWAKVVQLQQSQDVVVVVYRDAHQSG